MSLSTIKKMVVRESHPILKEIEHWESDCRTVTPSCLTHDAPFHHLKDSAHTIHTKDHNFKDSTQTTY